MKVQLKQFLENYKEEVRQAAEEMREEPLPEITEELFALFEETGNRVTYENVYFRRRKFLAVYGMAAILEEKPQDIHKLCEVIQDICGEVCWALPAHVNRKGHPDRWMVTVDLFASETAFALTEIGAHCKELLPVEILELIREKVTERVLLPFETSPVPYGIWENNLHNWNAVCSGCIGCTAIYLWKDQPERLDKLLERLKASLTHYVEGFAEDGTCMEGVSYFTYGMSFYAAFSDMLEQYTKGQVDLMAGEKVKRIMEFQQKCYFPGGLSVSFSDGSSHESFRVGLTCFLSRKDPGVKFPPMAVAAHLTSDNCYRFAELYRDYAFTKDFLETLPENETEKETQQSSIQLTLPFAQWSICRGTMESAAAVKGGHNGEPHNHNDVGSFQYVVGKEQFLADLGAGEYTREYFKNETRYQIFVNRSLSHNIPLINGQEQKSGAEYGCTRFSTNGKGSTEMELQGAYGVSELKSFVRTLDFSELEGMLSVRDVFQGDENLKILENLVTPYVPEIRENRVILYGESHGCMLEIQTEEPIHTRSMTYPDHHGNPVTVYLIQWEVLVTEGQGVAAFCISPMPQEQL